MPPIDAITRESRHKVAFFFIGADRRALVEEVARGAAPDSMLRGANFFALREGWQVDTISTEQFEKRLPRLIRRMLPMSLAHLVFVPQLLRYDAVIASDAFLVGALVSLFGKTKWVYVAINSSVLMKRHAWHPLKRAILRFAWSRFAAIVCLSRTQQEDLSRFGIRRELLHEIRFGVDTEYFTRRPEGVSILSVGKDLGRDYATLLQAAARTRLPIEIVTAPKNLPRTTALPPNVTVRYEVPLAQLREAYARAKIIVVVSLPEESAAGADCSGQIVILEALAMGRAVIATSRAWLSEYLEPGQDFCEVPAQDPGALARAIEKLWGEEALRARLRESGARKVANEYSSKRFASDLMALTERLLQV